MIAKNKEREKRSAVRRYLVRRVAHTSNHETVRKENLFRKKKDLKERERKKGADERKNLDRPKGWDFHQNFRSFRTREENSLA